LIVREASRTRLIEQAAAAYGALSMSDASGTNLLFVPAPAELLG
jgi:hypothetical protein